jgi:hypothetical protein
MEARYRHWKRPFWDTLTTVALSYPAQPTATDRKRMYRRIVDVPSLTTDPAFNSAYAKLLDAQPVAPYLDSRSALLTWLARFRAAMYGIYGEHCAVQTVDAMVADYGSRMLELPPRRRSIREYALGAVGVTGLATWAYASWCER